MVVRMLDHVSAARSAPWAICLPRHSPQNWHGDRGGAAAADALPLSNMNQPCGPLMARIGVVPPCALTVVFLD